VTVNVHRTTIFLLAIILAGLEPTSAQSPATPQPGQPAQLTPGFPQGTLDQLLQSSALKSHLSFTVHDAMSGDVLFDYQGHQPRNPASNMKLITAATALAKLGGHFSWITGFYGTPEPSGYLPRLTVRGSGDPSLSSRDLLVIAAKLKTLGVRSVGEVMVVDGYFDNQILPPGFEQKPKEFAAFRAPVSAFSVNASAYTLTITPAQADQPAHVVVDGSGYFIIDNRVTTATGKAPNVIAEQIPRTGQMELRLRGQVPVGSSGISVKRRVEDPSTYAGHALVEALRTLGVGGKARVLVSRAQLDAIPQLATHRSPPLAVVLRALGKDSDNFYAEMILKTVAAEAMHKPGSSSQGVQIATRFMEQLGATDTGTRMVNGSGLYAGNLVTSSQLTRLLVAMHGRSDARPEYIAHLAVAGVDGTLSKRLGNKPTRGVIWAKTGTLDNVAALSGYILGPSAGKVWAFSFLADNIEGHVGEARSLCDQALRILTQNLYKAEAAAAL